jgi:hypothetical protein
MRVRVERLHFSYGATPALKGVDFEEIGPGSPAS